MLLSLLGPILILALLVAALLIFQNRLLYFPATAQLQDYVPSGMFAWPDSGTESQSHEVLGLVSPPPENIDTRGTVVIFHGNAGHAGHRAYYAQKLNPLGLRTILAEYPGYGPRAGKPDEKTIVDDAVNIARYAHERYGDPLWIMGESLGAGVAAAVSGRVPQLAQGVVLITPWNRLADVAAHHYPFLPARLLLRSKYDSIEALASFDGPKLVVTAAQDTIVPFQLGENLHSNIEQPKRLINMIGAGHNDWITATPAGFWEDIMLWLDTHKR